MMKRSPKKTPFADQLFASLVRSGNLPLPGAVSESREIVRLSHGQFFEGDEATKERFLNQAADYDVIHLSMHGIFDQDEPMQSRLLFSNSAGDDLEEYALHAHEIYSMDLTSDLVVLSACETGVGSFERGVEIMSLSRAFSYAGVKAALMSLWSVPDLATSKIMVAFYKKSCTRPIQRCRFAASQN